MIRRFAAKFMSLFRREEYDRRLEQELEEHIALLTKEKIRAGLSPDVARREAVLTFGSVEALKDAYRDERGLPWLESLASDVDFGCRQLKKYPAASAAAILSLALAIGATTAAFRLVDAVLLRKLPVANADRFLFAATTFVDRDGRPDYHEGFDYPSYVRYQQAVATEADLMVVGTVSRQDAIVDRSEEPEKVYRQYVSGNVFPLFGLRPALARLLTREDDVTPGGHPVAVISYDFWSRRFARSPDVVGKTLRLGKYQFTIVGVGPKGFVGTEPGEIADVFIPAVMNVEALRSPGWSWFRVWVLPKEGVSSEMVRARLHAVFAAEHREQVKGFQSDTPQQVIDNFLREDVILLPASAGVSRTQKDYRRPLLILTFLVAVVLLLACVNVANLLLGQAAGRAREFALRISIGAGRRRLVQLMLVQGVLVAVTASAAGAAFASWSAPAVARMLRAPADPVQIVFETGWRELAFSGALALLVTCLFGVLPALRASAVDPVAALKGQDHAPPARRIVNAFLAAQVAFCVVVLFIAGLFVTTFDRLAKRPIGFSPERVLVIEIEAEREQPAEVWLQAADDLRGTPGVEAVSLAGWPLLSMNRWTGTVRIPGRPVEIRQPNLLEVSPRFFETMRIGQIDGRDFRRGDLPPRIVSGEPMTGVGIVNETFAHLFFEGQNPVGRFVDVRRAKDVAARMEIVGYVRDAAYRDLREPIPPTVYLPILKRGHNALLVRTVSEPMALAPTLRARLRQIRPELRVRTVETQMDFVRSHLLRERLLATLSRFFGLVALVLAASGLYGVINASVTRRRREIGIRIALGARSSRVVTNVTADVFRMLLIGAAVGLSVAAIAARSFESLLFGVKAMDADAIGVPLFALGLAAVLASAGPAIRAVRTDPAETLRSE
jgi:predicted permease